MNGTVQAGEGYARTRTSHARGWARFSWPYRAGLTSAGLGARPTAQQPSERATCVRHGYLDPSPLRQASPRQVTDLRGTEGK